MMNEQRIYLFDQFQTSQASGQTYSDTTCSYKVFSAHS